MERVVVLEGGMGDFLQFIPFCQANRHNFKYVCITHLKGAKGLFDGVGIDLKKLYFYGDDKEKAAIVSGLPQSVQYLRCSRAQYFSGSPFKAEKLLFDNGKPVVGIHVNGSAYSLNTQKQLGMVLKAIPSALIKELVSDRYNIIVFGLRYEIEIMGLNEGDNLKFVTNENPAISLAYVQQCNVVIASDSGIKTMSSMLKIPTLVWLGDYQDIPRDKFFINPYVKDGVMKLFKYQNLDSQFNDGVKLSKEFLKTFL
jgi:hypothetical protein